MKNIVLVTLMLLVSVVFFCSTSEMNDKKTLKKIKQPNILFISVDDLRPELGCYGNKYVKSPNIDAFSEEAAIFTNTHCQSAVCAPSRASMMTGLRPDSTRVWYLGDEFRKTIPNVVTMPQYFQKKGYYTVNIGKIFHNYMPDSVSWNEPDLKPAPYNGQEYINRDAETIYHTDLSRQVQEKRREEILKKTVPGKKLYADGWYSGPAFEIADLPDSVFYDGLQTKLAIQTLRRIKDRKEPFFMGLGYFRPHLPFVAPKKYWDMYPPGSIPPATNPNMPKNAPIMSDDSNYELRNYVGYQGVYRPSGRSLPPDSADLLKRGYYASVSYIDACIGELLVALKEMGLYENTIIVIWGDHGWKLGEHNGWGKQTNFYVDTHTPLMFKAAGQHKGMKSNALTELVDVFPTLCDLAGIEKAGYFQGSSMLPLMENPDRKWKPAVFTQFRRTARVSQDGKEYMGYSMQTEKYHYIEWYQWDNEKKVSGNFVAKELYDHTKDLDENTNLAVEDEYTTLINELSAQLKSGWRAALPSLSK